MSRPARRGRAWRGGAALLLGGLTLAGFGSRAGSSQAPPPRTVQVGEVTAVAETADLDLAVALAERADRATEWYGLGRRGPGRLAVVVVRGEAGFGAISRGRIPSWGAGLTLPTSRVVAVRADAGDPFGILRHELAHLVLHDAIRGRVPLWFDEGYATVAAGEFDRLDQLRLNLGVALARIPSLAGLDAALRGGRTEANAAYSLAATAVLFLARGHPSGSLAPLLERLAAGVPFDSSVTLTTGLTADRFAEAWRRDVKRRHGLGLWLIAGGMWALLGVLVIVAARLRKARDVDRRAALDVGWIVPIDGDDPGTATGQQTGANPLDRPRQDPYP
jgi:hypothetical protein